MKVPLLLSSLVLFTVLYTACAAPSPLAGVDGQDTPCQNDIVIHDDAQLSLNLAQARKTYAYCHKKTDYK